MVFGDAVELGGEVVVVALVGQPDGVAQLHAAEAAVGEPHRLVPQELDGVAVAGDSLLDGVGTADGRAVGRHQVVGVQRQQVVDAVQHDAWVAVLLAANGEHVEQHRPHEVVHGRAEFGEPVGDRVVGVGRCGLHVHREAGHLQFACPVEGSVHGHVARREGRVRRVAVVEPEAHVRARVGPVDRQRDGELFDEAAPVGGADLCCGSGAIEGDAGVAVDGKPAGIEAAFVENRLGAAHVMEVRVEHGHHRSVGDRAEFGQRGAHLLHALAGVDGDDALGRVDERLVREAVAHQ